jgi:hypothetical protein
MFEGHRIAGKYKWFMHKMSKLSLEKSQFLVSKSQLIIGKISFRGYK